MAGSTYGNPGAQSTYYRCPHNPATPKHAATCPDHPRIVQAPELLLDEIVGRFFADRIFGPGRAELLAAQLPATDADALADRDAQAARLQARIKRIETAQNSQILELEQLPADPADTASAAMRARIRARFADLHHEREQIETQLAALAKTTPAAADPALLDELPALGDILPSLPPALKARLFAAFGLEILWNKPGQQATVFVEITENTLQAIPGITDPGQDGYHDTSTETSTDDPAPMWDLGNTPRQGRESHPCVLILGESCRCAISAGNGEVREGCQGQVLAANRPGGRGTRHFAHQGPSARIAHLVQARCPVPQGAGELGCERYRVHLRQAGEGDPDARRRGDAEPLARGHRPARRSQ